MRLGQNWSVLRSAFLGSLSDETINSFEQRDRRIPHLIQLVTVRGVGDQHFSTSLRLTVLHGR